MVAVCALAAGISGVLTWRALRAGAANQLPTTQQGGAQPGGAPLGGGWGRRTAAANLQAPAKGPAEVEASDVDTRATDV